jgi:monofunctional biosynthetic peptidoglycan transglycosylase
MSAANPLTRRAGAHALRLAALLAVCFLALQVYFVARIALMTVADPQSTTFQRSEIWRLLTQSGRVAWGQQWVDDEHLGKHIKRAVIASEDAGFADHGGVDWEAMERAWERNQRAQEQAERRYERALKRSPDKAIEPVAAKLVGASTITQQLAKNLFLSAERTPLRKGQELVLTYALELLLSKRRILEIYLNNVEWGEGLFGAQAAARYYFRKDAAQLDVAQAARLAVMLPAPKRFEKRVGSPYLADRAATVAARMAAVEVP